MASLRTHHFIAGLALVAASQLSLPAQDNSAATDNSDGARTIEPADAVAPKERPRLKDNEVVSLKRRLEVHGGMSFTYGWASGGRNFREASAWASYFDPESGLGLALGFSRFSGDTPYSYGYSPYGYGSTGWYPGAPRSAYDVDLFWVRPNFSLDIGFSQTEFARRSPFDGSGSGLRSRRF